MRLTEVFTLFQHSLPPGAPNHGEEWLSIQASIFFVFRFYHQHSTYHGAIHLRRMRDARDTESRFNCAAYQLQSRN